MLYERNTGGIYELLFKGESICVLRDTEDNEEMVCGATMFDTTFKPVPETRKVWVNLYWDSKIKQIVSGNNCDSANKAERAAKLIVCDDYVLLKTVELEIPA